MVLTTILAFLVFATSCFRLYLHFSTGRYKIRKSLKGKHILITGGTAGVGKATVRELVNHGATVHVLARNMKKAETMIEEMKSISDIDVQAHELDLSSFQSVRQFAKKFLATGLPINVLINNAGQGNLLKQVTVDGNEEICQANHLSHFLLTNLLLDRIIESGPGSRIVNVSSRAFRSVVEFDLSDLNFEKQPYGMSGLYAYWYSKLENVLFTRELARRLYGKGVTTNSLHPGFVRTDFASRLPWYHWLRLLMSTSVVFGKSPLDGAQTTIYLSVADEVADVSGHYFEDCKPAWTTLLALDDKIASDLWDESARLTGLEK